MLDLVKNKVRTSLCRRWGVPSIPLGLERLRQNGFNPQHIFDVGAYQGDFASLCFQLWPKTKVTCFEVLEKPSERIRAIAKSNDNLRLIPCLLGATVCSQVSFNVAETASSVLLEREHPIGERSMFPMKTVDSMVIENIDDKAPDFLKMDVQGYELEVLKGSVNTLHRLQVILAEVNFLDIHQDIPLLADMVRWLADRGWAAYDICGLVRRPLDQALWQADFLFVPENSSLRCNKRYA